MPFDFNTVYRVMVNDPNLSEEPYFLGVAVGVRPFTGDLPEPYVGVDHGYEWIPNHPWWERRREFLRVEEDTPSRIEATSTLAERRGKERTYTFEPLTLSNIAEVKTDISNYDKLIATINSDTELQQFYLDDWLREGWEIKPEFVKEEDVSIGVLLLRAKLVEAELAELGEAKAAKVGDLRYWKSREAWMKKLGPGEWERVETPDDAPDHSVINVGGSYLQKIGDKWKKVKGKGRELPGKWKDKAEGLPSNTDSYHRDPETGDYTEERKKLHARLIQSIFSNVEPVSEDVSPVAVLTMGLPASGKSTAVEETMNRTNFAHIDVDKIRSELPEFKEAVAQRARNGGSIVNVEASNIADKALHKAMKDKNNLVFEGVGRDKDWMLRGLIRPLSKAGFRVKLLFVHEDDVDAAIQRADERGRKTGRFVPHQGIRASQPAIPKVFSEVESEVHDFFVFKSAEVPVLMWERKGDIDVIKDEDFAAKVRGKTEWWEALLSEKPNLPDKPPSVDHKEVLDMFKEAWKKDKEALDKLDDAHEDGVQVPADDPVPV